MAPAAVPVDVPPPARWQPRDGAALADPVVAAFGAGAALRALDGVIGVNPSWLGALRQRQALASAVVSARLLRFSADEADLRDARHLTRPGDDPGPAGRMYLAWHDLAARPTRLRGAELVRLAAGLGLALDGERADSIIDGIRGVTPIDQAASAATVVMRTMAGEGGTAAQVLAWMAADLALASACHWSHPVPLLATAVMQAGLNRGPEGRRPLPGGEGAGEAAWRTHCHGALALAMTDAQGRAADMQRRMLALQAACSVMRSRGGEAALAFVLGDDSVMATTLKGLGSERSARRFLDRLHRLGGLRLLTERPTFRLYGI